MKFKDYLYERPDLKKLNNKFEKLFLEFSNSDSPEKQIEIIEKINELRNNFEGMNEIAEIRHTIDTENKYYTDENDFFDTAEAEYKSIVDTYYKEINKSKFKNDLKIYFGEHLFNIIEATLKTFSKGIKNDLITENKLMSEYTKLRSSAVILFNNKEYNLEQMIPFYESKDRNIRKAAQEATTIFWIENENIFDEIYDKLVKIRDKIAKKLGFDNFIELGYLRLNRTDYNSFDVAKYRNQVFEEIVPLATELRNRQMRRLELDTLNYYDEPLAFITGNATPKGDSSWILNQGKILYNELSSETGEFFEFMTDNELMDLEAKKGKAGGGYCTFINNYKSPFIFSNFNGTSGDIDVLTHEAGHAFQCFQSRNYKLPEYVWPTLEACEIHSMSMEFFTWSWMKNIFKEDEIKYKYNHLSEAILFIPYGVLVDEFQHYVYENPDISPAERKLKWRELEQKYLPHRKYPDNQFLERGGFWFKQGHIFNDPFYYIDYTLAQVCAFQFFSIMQNDFKKAWENYIKLCKLGGSLPFLKLINAAELKNPFNEGSISSVLPALKNWLDKIDDTKL